MEEKQTVVQENALQVLHDTLQKIEGLRCFHIPIAAKVNEQYEEAGIDGYFMEQQKLQMQKLLDLLAQLEAKLERLQQRLRF